MGTVRTAALSAALALMASLACGLEAERFKVGETECLRLANEYYEMVVVPGFGGRIFQWRNKIAGASYANVKIPENRKGKSELGGLLDDRGYFTDMEYRAVLSRLDEHTVAVILTAFAEERQLGIKKTLTFRDASPVVNVRYRYENRSPFNVAGFQLGVRNYCHPSGDGVSPDDRYYLPTTHTLRRLVGYTHADESGKPMPEMGDKLITTVADTWHGLLNLPGRRGFAVRHRDDFYGGWYVWKGHVKYPTYEWTFQSLPGGHCRETSLDLIQIDDFGGLAFASADVLMAGRMEVRDGKLRTETEIKPLRRLGKPRLWTAAVGVGFEWKSNPVARDLPSAEAGKNVSASLEFAVPGDGTYAVTQRLLDGDAVVGEWRESVLVGAKAKTEPVLARLPSVAGENSVIEGWQALPAPTTEVGPEDNQRGFALLHPLRDNRYARLEKLEVEIAANEFESREMLVAPLDYEGEVRFSLKAAPGLEAVLLAQEDVVFDASKFGLARPRRGLFLRPDLPLVLDGKRSLWLRVGGPATRPGTYSLEITLEGSFGRRAVVPATVTVHEIALPSRRLVHLEAEGYPATFPGANKPDILAGWYRNLATHGVDFFQFYHGMVKADVNYARQEPFIDQALAHGLVIFKCDRYAVTAPPEQEKERWRGLHAYLRGKGFQNKDLFVKVLDEMPKDRFPEMAATAQWLKELGFRPFSTFHNLFSDPDALRLLDGRFDMFQGGFTTRADAVQRRKEGLLKPDDIFLRYTGWGTNWQTYMTMLRFGIEAAALEMPVFHNHEYMRGGNGRMVANIVKVGDDNLPVDSPAFEGLRDGMDVANLAELYRQWRTRLAGDAGKAQLLKELDGEFRRVFDGDDARFKLTTTELFGTASEELAPFTFQNYLDARRILFGLLGRLRQACLADGKDYATATWNDRVLYSDGANFSVAAGSEEERRAAGLFRERLAARLDVPATALDKEKKGLTVAFVLDTALTGTYTITEEAERITVKASKPAHFPLAIGNWLNTMEISGVWR